MSFAETLAAGVGRVEYIFHVGGMPWAVATSKTVITQLSSANRITMFGDETYNGGAQNWADEVDIYPLLETPGAQTVSVSDGFGKIDGGTWTARIADIAVKPTLWTHGHRQIWGLEGLQAVANPRVDSSIKSAKIAAVCNKAATTLKWTDDPGAALYTAVNAASTTYPFVCWIGGECLAFTTAADNADGSYTGTSAAGLRGLLNSKKCYHSPNRYQDGAASEVICENPLNGIGGRPYYLWAVILDDAGDIVEGPVKYRHGKVGSDTNFDGEFWSVQCLPWWKWLDTELNIPTITATMAGFTFSRPETSWGEMSTNCFPHMRMIEWDNSAGAWSEWKDIWLCDAGKTIHFDSVGTLEEAIRDELNATSPGGWTYASSDWGAIPELDTDDMAAIAGPLPFILGWWHTSGPNHKHHMGFRSNAAANRWQPITAVDSDYETQPTDTNWYGSPADWLMLRLSEGEITAGLALMETPRPVPRYIMQYRMELATMLDFGSSMMPLFDGFNYIKRSLPISPEPVSGEARIYINPSSDITTITSADIIQIGSEETTKSFNWWDVASFDAANAQPSTLSKIAVASVGAGGDDANYIVAAIVDGEAWGYPSIGAQVAEGEMSPKKLWHPAEMIYWNPGFQTVDPWQVCQLFDIEANSLGDLYKALLGETVAGVTVPEQLQTDHIPDYDTVDWTQLDTFANPLTQPFPVTFNLRYAGKLNPWSLFVEELKFYGLSPTYEWNETSGMFKIGFRRVGTNNTTLAYWGGRVIDSDVLATGTAITASTSHEWQLNSIDLSINWSAKNEKFDGKFQILDHSGYAPTGGKINSVSIEPRLTHITGVMENADTQAAAIIYFSSMLDSMMNPRPSQKVEATLKNNIQMGVGVPLLVTASAVHNPFTGEPGITDFPAIISEMTTDPGKGVANYTYLLSAKNQYGWAPSLLATTLTDQGGNVWRVTAVSGSGRAYCGSCSTTGWYDHWWFADCTYNPSMSAPHLESSDHFRVKAIQVGSATPTVISNIEVTAVTLSSYATIIAGGGYFLELYDATGVLSNANDWYIIYDAHNSANIKSQQKRFVFIASYIGALLNSDSTTEVTREWV